MQLSNIFKEVNRVGVMRAGVLSTHHGEVKTPVFMPVGTQGCVKALTTEDLEKLGAQIILANTYHLYLRPGSKLIEDMGGLHKWMRWSRPILTDSGGYQVSSLGGEIDSGGVTFSSHWDGSKHRLTPAKATRIQRQLGVDIMMAFDEATPEKGKIYAREAMERTHQWLKKSIKEWRNDSESKQALFGIIQGGDYADLRKQSAEFVASLNLPGIAIGGGSVGVTVEQTSENVAWVRDYIPKEKPVYLMGVGVSPGAAVAAVQAGADMFDCVAPTRLARCGLLYTGRLMIPKSGVEGASFESPDDKGRIYISKKQYETDNGPIEKTCDCETCLNGYTRSYLRHLFKSRELTYYRLASIHNLRMMVRTVELLRLEMVP